MTTLSTLKTACVILLVGAATIITAPAQIFTSLASFSGNDGEGPLYMSLVQGVDGNLYGTTAYGGGGGYYECVYDEPGCGTVFRITPGGALTKVYSFCSQSDCADGEIPYAGVVQATDGNLYGTTLGTVFKMSLKGALTTLYTFCGLPGCPGGGLPYAGLIQATDGNFYGTTNLGGTYGYGTVFKITTGGVFTTLHSFNRTDGANPVAGLIQGTDGSIYGATPVGGNSSCNAPPVNGCGTIFKIAPNGSFTTLHNFEGNDGDAPYGGLLEASDGALYGTTYQGGSEGFGTVFRITLSGKLTTIHNFIDDGYEPSGTLIQATDGNLYGTTQQEGSICPNQGLGTIFRITPEGAFTTLHTFDGSDGSSPYGGLTQGTNGQLYGSTNVGGEFTCNAFGCGTIFSLDMGLGPFVSLLRNPAKIGQMFGILGQGFTGSTNVSLNGTPATFTVKSDTLITAIVPAGATTGYVTVTTPSGTLTSNVPFRVIP
jgi:uncharacterized repeat protein (TIGR03803 family)